MFKVNYKNVDRLVKEQQAKGTDVRWDGWDLVFFRPEKHSYSSKHGVYRNGSWGYDNRIAVNESGIYEIDTRNLRR